MVRIYHPAQQSHPTLWTFAVMAAWSSVLVKTVQELEDLNVDLTPEERQLPSSAMPWPWEFHAVSVALYVVQLHREEAERGPAELLAAWMTEDRENWPVLRLPLVVPWQERPGIVGGHPGVDPHARHHRHHRADDGGSVWSQASATIGSADHPVLP
jgi:hypothetical protein